MNNSFENTLKIKERVLKAAEKSGRTEKDVTIIAVTKTVEPERILPIKRAGIDIIGENKAQELLSKYNALRDTFDCHFIGHLQTNKVKSIADKVSFIQSLDSIHLAKEIDKQCAAINKTMNVLVEINIGGEENKSGISLTETEEFLCKISELKNIKVRGLMTIPPICVEKRELIAFFERMYNIFIDIKAKKIDNISMDFLSMGMSEDFEEAILSGSNMVRIGRLLFGERIY